MFNRLILKFLTIFFTFSLSLLANTLDISKEINLDTYKNIYYIKDNNYTVNEAKKLQFKKLEKSHIGTAKGPFWTKITLTNNSNFTKDLVLHNPLAGTNKIEVFLFENQKLIKNFEIGDFIPQKDVEFLSRYPSFNLILNPNQTITIYSKIENFGVYNLTWHIDDYKKFFTEETNRFIKFGLLIGIGVFFIIVNLINQCK